MKKGFLLLVISIISVAVNARSEPVGIQGRVVDGKGRPIAFATIALLSLPDSLLVAGTISDSTGMFGLESRIAGARCLLRISHVGYETSLLEYPAGIAGEPLRIALEEAAVGLDEVTVRGDFVRQRFDRLEVNLKGNPLTVAKTTMETLALMPGVMEINGSLMINGKAVSEVYLNGRKLYGYDELKTIPASYIERIEILPEIRNRHDATQRGGAIYIHMRKSPESGGFGSVMGDLKFRQEKNNMESVATPFSFRTGKMSFYNNLFVEHSRTPYVTEWESQDDANAALRRNRLREETKGNFLSEVFSAVWDASRAHSVGVNFTFRGQRNDNKAESSYTGPSYESEAGGSDYDKDGEMSFTRYQIGLDHSYQPASGNIERWHTVVDFLRQKENSDEHISDTLAHYNRFENRLNLLTIKSDLDMRLNDAMSLTVGVDHYTNRVDNENEYTDRLTAGWTGDPDRSDLFSYEGYGVGGYADWVYTAGKFTWNASLRLQRDWINNHFQAADIRKKYLHVFPAVDISYALDAEKGNRLSLRYEKSMGSIPYREMNPAIVYRSDYLYEKGNPDIDPSVYHELTARANLLNNWILSYSYTYEKDRYFSMLYHDKKNPQVMYMMPTNVGKTCEHSLYVGWNKRFCPYYFLNASLSGSYTKERGPEVNHEMWRALVLLSNDITIPRVANANISFMYEPRFRTVETTYHSVYNLMLSLSKSLLDDRLNLSCRVYNILYKSRILTTRTNEGLYLREKNATPYRGVMFSVTYKFNFGKRVNVKKVNLIQSVEDADLGK